MEIGRRGLEEREREERDREEREVEIRRSCSLQLQDTVAMNNVYREELERLK